MHYDGTLKSARDDDEGWYDQFTSVEVHEPLQVTWWQLKQEYVRFYLNEIPRKTVINQR